LVLRISSYVLYFVGVIHNEKDNNDDMKLKPKLKLWYYSLQYLLTLQQPARANKTKKAHK
jgi:hypothetical protein